MLITHGIREIISPILILTLCYVKLSSFFLEENKDPVKNIAIVILQASGAFFFPDLRVQFLREALSSC